MISYLPHHTHLYCRYVARYFDLPKYQFLFPCSTSTALNGYVAYLFSENLVTDRQPRNCRLRTSSVSSTFISRSIHFLNVKLNIVLVRVQFTAPQVSTFRKLALFPSLTSLSLNSFTSCSALTKVTIICPVHCHLALARCSGA